MALEVRSYLQAFFLELKFAMFLCEAVTIDDLKGKKGSCHGSYKGMARGVRIETAVKGRVEHVPRRFERREDVSIPCPEPIP
jgi:hypothetical protein